MKIVFTGGGSGGHFYPIIAVAEEIGAIALERKLLDPKLYYIGPEPYDKRALYENGIEFRRGPAGKVRRYASILNVLDVFKTGWGIVRSLWLLYRIYPDVVFSKGGYASFPTVVAARLLRIPVVIHESDASPGRANKWAGSFARKIAVAYPETADQFPQDRVAFTGNPVRRALFTVGKETGKDFFGLDASLPTILVLGGSQGSQRINDAILDALLKLVEKYQIVHQTGKANFEEVNRTARFILRDNPYQHRYKSFAFMSALELRMAAGASMLAVSRAGSNAIFEIAAWGLPAILIPIPEAYSHDQRKNAFAYARSRAAIVIEEKNLTPNLLASEVDRLVDNEELRAKMSAEAKNFATPEAARTIAQGIIDIALSHAR